MGQAESASVFIHPPYVVTVDELVAHWVGRDAELREHHNQHQHGHGHPHQHQHHRRGSSGRMRRRRRRSGGGGSGSGGGVLAIAPQGHHHHPQQHVMEEKETRQATTTSTTAAAMLLRTTATTSTTSSRRSSSNAGGPSVSLVTVRRRDGVEEVICRAVAYGGRIPLPPLEEGEEVVVCFSDGSTARLPAGAVRAQAGMGEALYALQEEEEEEEEEPGHRHQLVFRVECRGETEGEGDVQIVPYDPTGGAAALLPLQLAGEREVQVAAVLVNMACRSPDLTGLALLLLGLLLFAEAYRRVAAAAGVGQGLGGGGQEGRRALRAAAAGLELVAERCMARRRSSVPEPFVAAGAGAPQHVRTRTRTVTMSTTTTTTTTTVMIVEQGAGADGVAAAAVEERRRTTRSQSVLAVVETVQEEEHTAAGQRPRRESALIVLAPEEMVPRRYLMVTGNDLARAQAMWAATLEWRRQYGADAILERPHTKFHTIKAHFPQFVAGRSKSGLPVYYENTGRINTGALQAAGITVDDLIFNYIYLNEYLYTRLVNDIDAQIITVVDVSGLSMGGLAPQSIEFATKSLALIQAHYPARAQVLLLVNAPSWFSWIWGVIKGAADEYTSKTLKVVSAAHTFKTLCEFIDPDQIPLEYGGSLQYPAGGDGDSSSQGSDDPLAAARRAHPHSVRWTSPFEAQIRQHVESVLAGLKDQGGARVEVVGAA